ncbi:alpha/beta hydrolase family protein [Kangiella marina]|uniref:Alpha/beta fold hydrolase n=1 Tax=Kangiella marina TaxID=1079178 RepID=A0ABP8IJK1_9GAMM
MSVKVKEVQFTADDGFELHGAVFSSIDSPHQRAGKTEQLLIIGSAFGVPYQYYKHVASFLAEQGIIVLVFDYRGISHSVNGNMATDSILMQHWGELDLEAAIQFAGNQYQPERLSYMGHSAGGQIIGLAPSSHRFDRIIIAASGVGSWRLWPGLQKYALAAVWYLVFPLVMALQFGDYFKSRFLGPIPVPKNAVKQWLRWARSKEYLFSPEHHLDISNYQNIEAKLLGMTITDDWYAPKEARDGLLKHYPNARKTIVEISPESIGLKRIGHFGLFKKKQEIRQGIWQPIVNFLQD